MYSNILYFAIMSFKFHYSFLISLCPFIVPLLFFVIISFMEKLSYDQLVMRFAVKMLVAKMITGKEPRTIRMFSSLIPINFDIA